MHEVKLIVDLMYQGGLSYMRYSISNTAEYGDLSRGSRIITDETRAEMKKILGEITSGAFAKEWVGEYQGGLKNFNALYDKDHGSQFEDRRPHAAQDDEVDRVQGGLGIDQGLLMIDSWVVDDRFFAVGEPV